MAVVQISKIQARRGLQQDLPQLSSAELGWSLDTRRLFIGNGTEEEGAPSEGVTEILTEHSDLGSILSSYIFKGNAGGYTAQTGPDAYHPTVRSWQDKVDEIVSVKDFGATGDGVTDDTLAIQRALTQLFSPLYVTNTVSARRALHFPAGVYLVSDILKLPTWARLTGDGINSTYIRQTNTLVDTLITFADSKSQTGVSIGTNGATYPGYVTLENLSLENLAGTSSDDYGDVVVIDSSRNCFLRNVAFVGSLSNPTTAGSYTYAGVKFKSQVQSCSNITFENCVFNNTRYALYANSNADNIRVMTSYVSGVYKAVKLGDTPPSATLPRNWKLIGNYFYSTANQAIDCYSGVTGILSSGNSYRDCGNNFAGTGSPVATIINFDGDGCYSIGDQFDRTAADDAVYVTVNSSNAKIISIDANVGIRAGNAVITTSGITTLLDNQTGASTGITLIDNSIVNYHITRNGSHRVGQFIFNQADSSFNDQFSGPESGLGITFSVFTGNLVLSYSSSSTGYDATIKYNSNYFK